MPTPVAIGDKAPDFTLPVVGGKTVSLKDFLGKYDIVLYFYPRDMTPGCIAEACAFRDQSAELQKLGAVVLGVSPDPVKSHENFIQKHTLNFPLLADVDHKVCEAYGVWCEKTNYGRKYMGVVRSTFVINKQGKIAKAWCKVKVPGHAQEVVEAIKALE